MAEFLIYQYVKNNCVNKYPNNHKTAIFQDKLGYVEIRGEMYNQMPTFNTTQYGYISIYLLNIGTNVIMILLHRAPLEQTKKEEKEKKEKKQQQ